MKGASRGRPSERGGLSRGLRWHVADGTSLLVGLRSQGAGNLASWTSRRSRPARMRAVLDLEELRQRGWTWWGGRRWLKFSLAVAVGFAAGTALYELATPWWVGDHIGLSLGACLFYAFTGLIWVAGLNVVYGIVWLSERLVKTERLDSYRKRVYPRVVGLGAASWPFWLATTIFSAWLSR